MRSGHSCTYPNSCSSGCSWKASPGASADVLATDSMLLDTYWDITPLARGAAEDFVRGLSPQGVAVMISAKSGTPHRRWPDGLSCRVSIDAFQWNLALEDPPEGRQFDAIFFSEVIEHLPVPGHIALGRLRKLPRPGGLLLRSTPNLYRLRKAFFLLTGRPLFDHSDLPGTGSGGHVLEYSAEHLAWQLERAGFVDYAVDLEDFTHVPNARLRPGAQLSAPRCAGSRATETTCLPLRPRPSRRPPRPRCGCGRGRVVVQED
jgi:hypothetical protein